MLESSNATDKVDAGSELANPGADRLFEETLSGSDGSPVDLSQASRDLVSTGQIPALEISSDTSLYSNGSFNAMISTEGLTIVNQPGRGVPDFFAQVDGLDDPGIFWNGEDGAITKSGIDSFIADADAYAPRRSSSPVKDQYVDALREISQNWDNPEMAPYKDTADTMTRESFAAGLESLASHQTTLPSAVSGDNSASISETGSEDVPAEAVADVPVDTSADTPVDTPVDTIVGPVDMPAETVAVAPADTAADTSGNTVEGPVDMPAEASTEQLLPAQALSEEAAQLSLVELGEGPYQVAARVLSAGEPASNDEIKALMRAMQAQYREEYPEDPNLASLKVNHQFITADKVDALLDSIPDPALRESIAAKLLQPAEAVSPAEALPETTTAETATAEVAVDPAAEPVVDANPISDDAVANDAISEHIEANQAEASQAESGLDVSVPATALTDEAAELSQVRSGEGPYQVAARILASGGSAASNAEVTALMRAMQTQYRQENPDDTNMAGLRSGYQFLTAENAESLLAGISDSGLRASIEAKIMQQAS